MKSLRKWLVPLSVMSLFALAGCADDDDDDDGGFTVEGEGGDDNDDEAEGEAKGSPGYGLLAALGAVGGALIFLGRRKA